MCGVATFLLSMVRANSSNPVHMVRLESEAGKVPGPEWVADGPFFRLFQFLPLAGNSGGLRRGIRGGWMLPLRQGRGYLPEKSLSGNILEGVRCLRE